MLIVEKRITTRRVCRSSRSSVDSKDSDQPASCYPKVSLRCCKSWAHHVEIGQTRHIHGVRATSAIAPIVTEAPRCARLGSRPGLVCSGSCSVLLFPNSRLKSFSQQSHLSSP